MMLVSNFKNSIVTIIDIATNNIIKCSKKHFKRRFCDVCKNIQIIIKKLLDILSLYRFIFIKI